MQNDYGGLLGFGGFRGFGGAAGMASRCRTAEFGVYTIL